MTDSEALYQFFSGFGLTAYPTSNIPDDTVFPWLTYEYITAMPFSTPVSIVVNIWYHTNSEAVLNAKAREIAEKIGRGGIQIPYDDGTIWLRMGNPWAIALSEADDTSVKRRQLNIDVQYH